MDVVWGIPYEPAFMPIEIIFSKVKLNYKAQRLNMITNGKQVDERALIRQAFKKIES